MNDDIKRSLKSIQRRHDVSIRRLNDIERRLEEVRMEAAVSYHDDGGGGLIQWFRSLLYRLSGRAHDDAA